MSGEIRISQIAALFGAVMYKRNSNADIMTFGYDAKYQMLNPVDSTMTLTERLSFNDGATNFHAIFSRADKAYKRVIILSDMQGWVQGGSPYKSAFKEYKKRFGCDPYLYSFDLTGNGSSMFPEYKISLVSGFSDKIFDTMKNSEIDKNALINEIEAVSL